MKLGRAYVALAVMALPVLLLTAGCQRQAERFNGQVVEPSEEGIRLAGTNWDEKPFQLADQEGKVTVVLFGYTFCPDVCPFALAKMKRLVDELGSQADEVSVVFVSVDPKRDTLAKLAEYVPNFDPRFYGVRQDPAQAQETRDQMGLTVQFGQPKHGPGTDSFYYVDHTGTYFVFDRQGHLRLEYPPTATVEQMLPDIRRLLRS